MSKQASNHPNKQQRAHAAAPYSNASPLCPLHHAMPHTIHHHEQDAKGAFYVENGGQRLAEMTYSRTNATMIIVDHTEVAPSLSGQGVGRELLGALVQWARATGTKVVPLCPFAKAQFDKDASIRDVLV
ncbi:MULTISPECIES: GNAT family N-acetyltransferase [Acidovorax]|nr:MULTISPECIES: GNAT family N-acetyltransferase [Acidovorax]